MNKRNKQLVSFTDPSRVCTGHARKRMQQRAISKEAISAVFDYGRVVYTRGATIYAIGRREVLMGKGLGVDLERFEGIHVVTSSDGSVLTAYRNHDFKSLRSGLGRHFSPFIKS